ncbi:hypothetical protein CC85DRAFT_286838 [Cutaneotrichosporon oleaginosum]|uniref:Uncharacterized protein n=1 Tax=Cutaneotrichosporon oleaginosum TaxID=879819 RepID=A0A0J0XIX9_9TREE|nr:uncharacterized protein CC85DRAFT_286838 [Cutaneotrichosporon oleaginosum]KLT41027.1 hypothetical protein CC85DRAFT_286838 [Cutaneotrichosporon oleaginosum]TXT12119.1 hypothetical protein COLE_02529 [Cutaneotrichosporon oleaginosum]
MPLASSYSSSSSRIKRRSVTLPSSRQPDAWNDFSADAESSEKHWESTLQSLDESNMSTERTTSLENQEGEILRLTREVIDLREELAARPTEDEVYAMRMEWETSETLFAQSQKDNEQKHNTIENLRQYVKALESKLEETLGEDWKDYCVLPDPRGSSNMCGNATPLPKPGKVRSTSIKRTSRHSHSRAVSAADARSLRELEIAVDKTPAGALRALEGICETSRPTPAEIVASFESPHKDARMERSTSHQSMRDTKDKEIAVLVAAVKALPATLGAHVERVLAQDEAQTRREEARQAILDMLDAAESRADAREIRLQGLLAEAKTCSGLMEW